MPKTSPLIPTPPSTETNSKRTVMRLNAYSHCSTIRQTNNRLIDAELYDKPALAGVVRLIEDDPDIATLVESDRFRQTVGRSSKAENGQARVAKDGQEGDSQKALVTS